jgi:hypothetical protein
VVWKLRHLWGRVDLRLLLALLAGLILGAARLAEEFTNRLYIFTFTNLLDFWWTPAATNLSTEDELLF